MLQISSCLYVAEEGLTWLSNAWKLCKPLKSKADVKELKDYLTNVWTNLAMVDYPYPANFLAPLPAYPIKASLFYSHKLGFIYSVGPLLMPLCFWFWLLLHCECSPLVLRPEVKIITPSEMVPIYHQTELCSRC